MPRSSQSRVKVFAGTLAFAGWTAAAGAQEASVSGRVLDESGAALPGATVTALSTASGKATNAVADEAGRYEIGALSAGPYRLTARLKGFSEVGHSVTLPAGEAATRDFTLEMGSLSEEITVTAAKGERPTSEIPQIVTIVGSNQIEDRRPAGVQEAVERTPSMRAIETNPYRARPQLRGLDGSRVALMLDGERLNNARFDAATAGVPLAIVEVAHLDSIEVVAGASSSLYGSDAMVGTVNLITKPPRRPESDMNLDARGDIDYQTNGDFKKGTLAANLASRKLAFRGTVSKFDLNDYDVSGRQGIDREDVLRLGRFAVELGNASAPGAPATNVAGNYGVFELPRGSEVPNGGGAGWSALADAWYYPTERQNVRFKYMRSRQEDLGAPFTGQPYSPLRHRASFSDFDKVGLRYEVLEITRWLSRASVGAYRQKLTRPQNDLRFDIVPGSSFVGTTPATRALTGRDSAYFPGIDNTTENNITSWGLDAQINVLPFQGVLYTTGIGYLQDESVDHFSRESRGSDGRIVRVTGLKTAPDTTYRNVGWFNQLEVTKVSWLRLSGGFRVDNWRSEAVPSLGYPPPSEEYVLETSLPQILADPGALSTAVLPGLESLLRDRGSLTTNSTVATGNIGATLMLPGGLNPYVRFGTSYREPEVTVRYGIRNFGPPTFSGQGMPNTELKPERGRSLDLGLKLDRREVRASVGYYRNDLSGFSSTVISPIYAIPPNPALGVLPNAAGAHLVQYFQRVTGDAKVHFRGWEGIGEASISLGNKGSVAPFVSLSWMKSIDDGPSAKDILIVQRYYNRPDTPIRLEGSVDEIPARPHPKTLGTIALRYNSPASNWWVEYEWRFAGRITNTDPENVLASVSPFPTQYGALKSLEGYDKHSIRGGMRFGREGRLRLSVGIENLYDSLFFLPYQNAPAPGRSLILGLTFEMKNVLGS